MEYHKRFFANLEKIQGNINCFQPDVALLSVEDGTSLKCHSIILSASSDYFINAFNWNTSLPIPAELEVHNGILGETIDTVIKFIYSGEINIHIDNVRDVMVAANYFQIPELVDICSSFLLVNLEIDSCVDILLLSWQLDLLPLFEEVTIFVAHNFSSILEHDFLKEKIHELPIKLLEALLKSKHLILRNSKTKLFTGPVKREKGILDFIVNYYDRKSLSLDDLSSLLDCVRWPVISSLGELDLLLESLSLLSLDTAVKDRLTDLSKCYLTSTANSNNSAYEGKVIEPRVFTCSELVSVHPIGTPSRILPFSGPSNEFRYVATEDKYISKMCIISRIWSGKTIVGGLSLDISSGTDIIRHHAGVTAENGLDFHTIDLKHGEHVISVGGNSGWLIDSLVFETSAKRLFGPYGGEGGEKADLMSRKTDYEAEDRCFHNKKYQLRRADSHHALDAEIPLGSVLIGMTGEEVTADADLAITHMRFIFRNMLPTSVLVESDETLANKKEFCYGDDDDSDDLYEYDDDGRRIGLR